ncbi:hypothetical protein M2128_002273 [Polynucleobacter sphagniphilus]|uniref:hypothetical protein n=1 Tax=Polynucleobacter sphagniphilus TaxID=1743169 RepID=UPI0024740965|nr:hypothetical protein [Polynucleobacter sphagniphilus]MDH6303326.1 hypothetical protein [Polynucleobacter sphagniphilus]
MTNKLDRLLVLLLRAETVSLNKNASASYLFYKNGKTIPSKYSAIAGGVEFAAIEDGSSGYLVRACRLSDGAAFAEYAAGTLSKAAGIFESPDLRVDFVCEISGESLSITFCHGASYE